VLVLIQTVEGPLLGLQFAAELLRKWF